MCVLDIAALERSPRLHDAPLRGEGKGLKATVFWSWTIASNDRAAASNCANVVEPRQIPTTPWRRLACTEALSSNSRKPPTPLHYRKALYRVEYMQNRANIEIRRGLDTAC